VLENPRPALILDPHCLLSDQRRTDSTTPAGSLLRNNRPIPPANCASLKSAEAEDWPTSSTTSKLRSKTSNPEPAIRGEIDSARRRDHMQQHSAQHVLSAAFVRLFNMPTVSIPHG